MKRINACVVLFAAAIGIAAFACYETVQAQRAAATAPEAPQAGTQIGALAPLFTLPDTEGTGHSLETYLANGKTVVLEWFNADCPYVKKYHAGITDNTTMHDAYAYAVENEIVWLAVNSNRPGSQGSGLELNQLARVEYGIEYPVLLDPEGTVGLAYGARNTPQIYIITPDRKLHYNGGADDTVLNTDVPGINYVINALTQIAAGEAVDPAQTPHPGCDVKYPK